MIAMIFWSMAVLMTHAVPAAQLFEQDTFQTREGMPLTITFVKHASLIFDFDGKVIYVDPVSAYADYSLLPKADLVLITHQHGDHLDPSAIAAVEKPATLLIANAASQAKLGKGQCMQNGDRRQPADWVRIEAVPAYNTTPGREMYHPLCRDNGYVLTLGGTRIYLAGDTEDIPEMSRLKGVDIAFLPVNQPYTMTVEQAAHAARMVQPHVLYPYHYSQTPVQKLRDLLKNDPAIEVRIRQLQ